MESIVRGRGKMILHGRANRRQWVTKPPVQENLLSPRMGNPNKSDHAKWHLLDKNDKMHMSPLYPGKIRFHLSTFHFCVHIFFSFFLCGKHPPLPKINETSLPKPPALTKGEIHFHLPPFHFCVHIFLSFFFVWKTSHPLCAANY